MKQITHEFLVENGLILFETIVGSQAYGTQTPSSDIDKKFVYILPQDFILGTGYVEQINVNKDYVGFNPILNLCLGYPNKKSHQSLC
jgi:predicted nucleotidyltransferase